MKVTGLDGRSYQLRLVCGASRQASTFHVRARNLLETLFPFDPRHEEVSLPGSGGLTADFLLPRQRLVVETHGQQHYAFSLHFHGTERGFLDAKQRDRNKARWCELNQFTYCELPHYEDDDQWRNRIVGH